MFYANRGMYLENLINHTSDYYKSCNLCLIFKRNIPISIIKNENNGYVRAKLLNKSSTDYYGVYQQKMFDFEAKQTNKLVFHDYLIKQHQINHLKLLSDYYHIPAFIIIHFVHYDTLFAIDIKDYLSISMKTKTIKYEWFIQHGYKLEIIFPGIIDIITYLEHWWSKENEKNNN